MACLARGYGQCRVGGILNRLELELMSTEALLVVARLDEAGFLKLRDDQQLIDVANLLDARMDWWGVDAVG